MLTTNATTYALGAVLNQSNHPISYASWTLNNHELNYPVIEKELLGAVVWSVKYFRTYLYGRKFTTRTDHKPLVWLNGIKEPKMKLQRWKITLYEYDFKIEYLKEKNCVADGLSRYIEQCSEETNLFKGSKEVCLRNIFANEDANVCDNNDEVIASIYETLLQTMNNTKDEYKIKGFEYKNVSNSFEISENLLLQAINKSFIDGILPDCSKEAVITPIPKIKGTNKLDVFRPVNMLQLESKIIGKVVYGQCQNYLESYNLISHYQSGFRKNNNCESLINLVIT